MPQHAIRNAPVPLKSLTAISLTTVPRHRQAVIKEGASRRHWPVRYAAIVFEGADPINPIPPPRSKNEGLFIGETVG